MKNILLVICLWLAGIGFAASAQNDRKDWQLHLAYHEATEVVSSGSSLYALMNGNLLVYDTSDQSVRTFDKLTGLSDKGIMHIGFSETLKCLVIYYQNNNIDLLYEDGEVVNIPQVKNYIEYTIVPRDLNVNGDWAAVSTTEGVVVLNIARAEVKGYYRIGQSVKSAVVLGNEVYASLDRQIIKGSMSDNLYDFSQWKKIYDLTANAFIPFEDGAYMLVPQVGGLTDAMSGVCYMGPAAADAVNPLTRVTFILFESGSYANGNIQFIAGNFMVTVDPKEPLKEAVRLPMTSAYHKVTCTSDGTYWMIDSKGNISNFKLDVPALSLTDTGVKVGGFGPKRDLCYHISYVGNRLMVSGGRMNYATGLFYPPTAMTYENGKWTNFQEEGFKLNDNASYHNVLAMAQVPNDPTRHYVASSSGLLEFKDGKFVQHFNASNSEIEIAKGGSNNPNYAIVDGLNFDKDGNLWMTNYEADKSLKVMKPDGTWLGFYDEAFNDIPTPEKTCIDRNGYVWVSSRRTTDASSSGLYALDCGGTLDYTEDDRSIYRSTAVNEDGNSCNIEYVKDICEDLNGQIWFGCASGVYAITEPENWFSSQSFLYQPKVPRNDGTNYADYLLTGIDVTAIAVDGGNRKWLGTMGSGIYLVSPDGSEVIQHITTADSPLLSDNIYSLALNQTTGELMIATDLGLCSYHTHIVPPVGKLSKDAVKVYPNPVRPEYFGNVTISGLTDGAEVKIVSTGSQLVARGNAVGGTYIWDVCNSTTGNRVAPGVYYILIAAADGSDSVAAKMVVI